FRGRGRRWHRRPRCTYIGGRTWFFSATTRLATMVPSAFLSAGTKTWAPFLRSDLSSGAKVTTWVLGSTTRSSPPPLEFAFSIRPLGALAAWARVALVTVSLPPFKSQG